MTTDKQKPEVTLSDANIKANIWKREGKNGAFHGTEFSRSYKDHEGNYQNSRTFHGTDLLKVAELAKQAYQQSRELDYKERQNNKSRSPKQNNDLER